MSAAETRPVVDDQSRFKGVWETKLLEEITDCLDGLRVPLNETQRSSMQGSFPYCGANGVLDHINDYVLDDDVVLMAEDGGHFDEYLTRPIAYRMTGPIWVNNHAHILKAKPNFDQGFLYYSLVHKDIRSFLASGTRAKLNKGEMVKIEVFAPNGLPEQRAIAAALSDVDDLLQSQDRLITKKRDVKQGAMQQLLTGTTRLPGFEGAWIHEQLGNCVEIQKGQLVTAADISPGSIPVVAGGREPAYYHSESNRYGTTITISASGASAGFVNRFVMPIWASDCSTISESSEYCIDFIYQLLRLRQAEIYNAQTGGAQPHIHPRDLMPLRVSLPSRNEQRAIAAVLSDMDAEIDALEARRDKVAAIKQGMMQELLTGRTRLPIPEEAIDA